MYLEFYGLNEEPFNLTPDSNFLFLSEQHRKALSHLKYGIEQKKGFIALTGEVGSGKTTVCRALLKMLDKDKFETALILSSFVSANSMLKMINGDLGIYGGEKDKEAMIHSLNKFLFKQREKGKTVVVLIDECQNLNFEVLEQIRMLSNLETEKEKLIQIVLIGQPEFLEKLSSHELRQLNQRITVRAHLSPLKYHECRDYIMHRLKIAGSDGSLEFTEKAVKKIFNYCYGIPRRINVICDYALIVGYVDETRKITRLIVKKALKEIEVKREISFRQKLEENKIVVEKKPLKVALYFLFFISLVGFGWLYRVPLISFFEARYTDFNKKLVYNMKGNSEYKIEQNVVVDADTEYFDRKVKKEENKIDVEVEAFEAPVAMEVNEDGKREVEDKNDIVADESISISVKGDVSIEDIPEGVVSSSKTEKRIEIKDKRIKPKTIKVAAKENPAYEELTSRQKALWLLLSAWGIDYNLKMKKGYDDWDMDVVIERFNYTVLETWEGLEYLVYMNLPFAIETKNNEIWVIHRINDSLLSVKKGPGQNETISILEFNGIWKGKSIVLLERGPYTLSAEKTYYRGDTDEEIIKLKKMLNELGYVLLEGDSFFDTECERVVKQFQRNFLFYPDGTVGTETILMLYSKFAQNVPRLDNN
ncbi:MAG: AAA family ATPase [Candidatus Aureabacteria bacterium]|nr:AAA family ATPase [Candidatus Auribacterota bacterium]